MRGFHQDQDPIAESVKGRIYASDRLLQLSAG